MLLRLFPTNDSPGVSGAPVATQALPEDQATVTLEPDREAQIKLMQARCVRAQSELLPCPRPDGSAGELNLQEAVPSTTATV